MQPEVIYFSMGICTASCWSRKTFNSCNLCDSPVRFQSRTHVACIMNQKVFRCEICVGCPRFISHLVESIFDVNVARHTKVLVLFLTSGLQHITVLSSVHYDILNLYCLKGFPDNICIHTPIKFLPFFINIIMIWPYQASFCGRPFACCTTPRLLCIRIIRSEMMAIQISVLQHCHGNHSVMSVEYQNQWNFFGEQLLMSLTSRCLDNVLLPVGQLYSWNSTLYQFCKCWVKVAILNGFISFCVCHICISAHKHH